MEVLTQTEFFAKVCQWIFDKECAPSDTMGDFITQIVHERDAEVRPGDDNLIDPGLMNDVINASNDRLSKFATHASDQSVPSSKMANRQRQCRSKMVILPITSIVGRTEWWTTPEFKNHIRPTQRQEFELILDGLFNIAECPFWLIARCMVWAIHFIQDHTPLINSLAERRILVARTAARLKTIVGHPVFPQVVNVKTEAVRDGLDSTYILSYDVRRAPDTDVMRFSWTCEQQAPNLARLLARANTLMGGREAFLLGQHSPNTPVHRLLTHPAFDPNMLRPMFAMSGHMFRPNKFAQRRATRPVDTDDEKQQTQPPRKMPRTGADSDCHDCDA